MKSFYIIVFFALFLSSESFSQDDNTLHSDTIPSLDFESDAELEAKPKKKKVKKKVFYGVKCKRGFTRKGVGNKEIIETFYFLKHYKEPNPYVRKVYVYDVRKQQVLELAEIKKTEVQFYKILHGPYKKTVGGNLIEQGIFHTGTKHGRWEKYAPEKKEMIKKEEEEQEITYSTLLAKEKFYKGWPKESRILFYDGAQTKIKEVFPYEHGKLNGDYYFFKESGEILIQGKYMDGKKVGLWIEYDKNKNKKIRETQHPVTPYVEQFEPYVLTEWNENGALIIQKGQAVEPGKKAADPLKERFKRKK